MRKLLLLTLACAAVYSVSAKPAHRFASTGIAKQSSAVTAVKHRAPQAHDASAWRARHEIVSVWEGEWLEYETYDRTYSSGLNPQVNTELCTDIESGAKSLTTNTWNENGRIAEILIANSEDGETFENAERTARTYDDIVTSFITSNSQWLWMEDSWEQAGNNYTQTITRDTDGNITLIERAVLFEGIFDPIYRLEIEYTDGKASKITQNDLTYDWGTDEYAWVKSLEVSDIEWERTNGQITDPTDLYLGENRILKAFMVNDDEEVLVTATYPEANTVKIERSGVVQGYENTKVNITYVVLPNGGYNQTTVYTTEEDGETYTETYVDKEEYDSYGNLLLYETVGYMDDESWVEDCIEGIVEYDEALGYPLTYFVKMANFDEETEEMSMEWFSRSEYSDFVDCAGLSPEVVNPSDDAPVYYNLSGIQVDASRLTSGVYIVRRGTEVRKQIVR